jgi:cell wall-associated NlpC family hydrolase
MIIKKRGLLHHAIASVCLATVMLCVGGPAWSADGHETPSALDEVFERFANRASDLVMQAMGFLGINYRYGGNTPESGLDCSGFVRLVFKEAWGSNLPRTSAELSRVGKPIAAKDLQPGDLVFYNTLKRSFSHVGIYLGDNKFIHSPSAGGKVRVESMTMDYWRKRFNGARRLENPNDGLARAGTHNS